MSSQNSAPGPPPGPRIASPYQQTFHLRTRRPNHPPPVQPSPFARRLARPLHHRRRFLRPGIVLVSSGSTLLSDFQNWRADMATMQGLAAHANRTCVAAPEKAGAENQQPQPHMRSRGLLGSALGSLADPTEAASVAGDVMQMFSSNQSVTSVTGTVQDPALMNEVARQLRALNVQVLIPELYNPLCPRRYRLRPLAVHAEPAKRLRRVGQMQRPSKPDTPQVPPRSPASTAFSPRFSPSLKRRSPRRHPDPHRAAATPPSTPALRPRARPPRRPRTSPRFSPPTSWQNALASPRPARPTPTAPGKICSGSRPSSPAAPSPNRATSSARRSSSAAALSTRAPSSPSRAISSAPATFTASSNPSTSRMFKPPSTRPAQTRPQSGCPNTAPAHRWPETNLAVWPRCLDAGLPEGRPQVRNLSSNGKTYDGECGVPCNKLGVAVVDSADLHSG
jgi:hypothetical protein